MHLYLALGIISFFLCFVLTPLCSQLAVRFGLVDQPDTLRKLHIRAVPRLGGVPIVVSYAGALLLVMHPSRYWGEVHIQHGAILWSLLPAAAVVFVTGLLDDLISLRPWQKLAGQTLGAAMAIGTGTHLVLSAHVATAPGLLQSPWVSFPLSFLWLIGCTNAVNLIDGLDGLASGVGLLATVAALVAAVITGNVGLLLATIPLVGCLLAFLLFNFNPASIFLGDSGSLTIGFMLGCFGLVWGRHTGTLFGMAAPLMALALPLVDVGLAICRRYLRHVPIFSGDRGHIHHMVLARGFKPHQTALLLYAVCAVAAGLALAESFGAKSLAGKAAIPFFVLLVLGGLRYLDYVEFGAAWRAISKKQVLRMVRDEIYLHELGRSLTDSQSTEERWQIVKTTCSDLGFTSLAMYFRGSYFEANFTETEAAPSEWQITVPLGDLGYISLARDEKEKTSRLGMAALMRIHESLAERAEVSPRSTSSSSRAA